MIMSITTPFLLLLVLILIGGCAEEAAQQEADSTPPAPVRIVFFGDSITEVGIEANGYITLVADSFKQGYPDRAIEVMGAGISGNKVPDLQARLESDVLAQQPTHVVIYIGINDVWHFYEFDEVTGTERDVFEQGLRDLIAEIEAAGATVLLCTPSVIGEDPASDTPVNQHLMEYAEISRTVANTTGAQLCDLRVAFEQHLSTNNPDNAYEGILTSDGVHLNEAGNRFVADFMIEHLTPFLMP